MDEEISGLIVGALVAAAFTYLFAGWIEEKKARHARHLHAEQEASNAVRNWRQDFLRDWADRTGGGSGSGIIGPSYDLNDLAAEILDLSAAMPTWKQTLSRKSLLVLAGEEAVMVSWLGRLKDSYRDSTSSSWFVTPFLLDTHFPAHLRKSHIATSNRFQHFDQVHWERINQESHFLLRVLQSRQRHRPLLRVRLSREEKKALKRFGYLPSMRYRFAPAWITPAIRFEEEESSP